MKTVSPKLIFGLLIALAYTLGTVVHLRAVNRMETESADEGAFKKLLGDGRRLFAGQFVEMADVYFHSGMYPSIFDRPDPKTPKAVTSAVDQHDEHENHEHDEQGNCVHESSHEGHAHDEHGNCQHDDHDDEHVKAMTPGAAQNWLEAFIRRFRITEHTHLTKGDEREILPWLKVAIELDPQAVETYTTAAYWLRQKLDRAEQAEEVLREGLRNNPKNYELLFELGLLAKESRHDFERARNTWRSALKCWRAQAEATGKADSLAFSKIASHLGKLENEAGNLSLAVEYFELAKQHSLQPDGLQKQIDELRARMAVP